jgi:hypothetical protein
MRISFETIWRADADRTISGPRLAADAMLAFV